MRYADLPGYKLRQAAKARREEPPRICMWCTGPLPPRRQAWCSDACVHEYKVRADASYVRSQLLERDGGVCARCRMPTEAIRAKLEAWMAREIAKLRFDYEWGDAYWRGQAAVRREFWGLLRSRLKIGASGHLWEAHHVRAVVEGGGWCGLEGYETLCMRCHHAESAALARRRADARRA